MKPRVLVCDDNEEIRELVTTILEEDYEVVPACDGENCIEQLTADSNFDLVILDVEMPNTNGWEALRVITDADNWPNIPVIMFTVLNEPENAVKAWHIGASFYMTKPFSATVLLETVQAALSNAEVEA